MKAYKYIEEQYLEGMLKEGKIKVGTLEEYSKSEDPERGDKNEGTGTSVMVYEKGVYSSKDIPIMQAIIDINNPGAELRIIMDGPVTFQASGRIENTYIYCMTKNPDEITMNKFDGKNVCVEIIDVKAFAKSISDALFLRGYTLSKKFHNDDCSYDGRNFKATNFFSDPFKIHWLKLYGFKHQDEHRLVFPPKLGTIVQPLLITVPEITRFLKQHFFYKNE